MKPRSSANPYSIHITRDVPNTVFASLVEIACTAMYGIEVRKTPALTILKVTKKEKLEMILNAMNLPLDVIVKRSDILHKKFSSWARAQVIINDNYSCMIRFNKNSERLTLNCKFGYWNEHGVPQHIW